ncbi:cellulose biosynthesis protein BcsN [Pararhodobacter zhoushanensis]|uniref:cellulose biosynthesis protein BcsN n=1 Tax=Pararhodobacter zhoushanensis TaxID=2479545 RepID=UPI000F8E4E14|nr:cellulose biosynthesis protein BcsN [Pararhodobacter zhoushanensis]
MINSVQGLVPQRSIASVAQRIFAARSTMGRAFLALTASVAVLAGCSEQAGNQAAGGVYGFFNSSRSPAMETLENTVEFAVVAPNRAMVNAPEALVVFERNLGGAIEQRIILPNATAMRGDNAIHIRAQTSGSADLNRLDFAQMSARFGGMPSPFETVQASSMQTGTDSLGAYLYATQNVGTGGVCVLVLRRLGVGARPLPRGTQALDVVMRNCVNGSLEQALAPMSGGAMGVGGAQGTIYTLSPHAAPRG